MFSFFFFFFFSSRRRHTRFSRDWSSDVCSSDLDQPPLLRSRRGLGSCFGRRPLRRTFEIGSEPRGRTYNDFLYLAFPWCAELWLVVVPLPGSGDPLLPRAH